MASSFAVSCIPQVSIFVRQRAGIGHQKALLTRNTDTVMSRLYNQHGNLYNGVLDCLAKTVRTEGFFAIYKGFLPHLARILPHTILTLSLAEQTNKLVRKVEGLILPIAETKL